MEAILTPPQSFRFDQNTLNIASGSLSEEWTKWQKGFMIYFDACELSKKAAGVQLNIFLHIVGEQCREILNHTGECKTLQDAYKKLNDYFLAKKNITVERHRFFTRNQLDNESIEHYVFDLRKLAASCEFGELTNDLIKDRLVCGVTSASIRERLLREDRLDLEKAMDICRAAIVSRVYSENIRCESEINRVHEVSNENTDDQVWFVRRGTGSRRRGQDFRGRGRRDGTSASGASGRPGGGGGPFPATAARARGYPRGGSSRGESSCGRCGTVHHKFNCPAYGKQCLRCSKMNHFARNCSVYYVVESEEQVIHSVNSDKSEWMVDLHINKTSVCFKLDTGADVNVLPERYLTKIGLSHKHLLKTNTKLSGYSGAAIEVLGKIFLRVSFRSKMYILEYIVANVSSVPILGRFACTELNVIKRVMSIESNNTAPDFVNEYKDVFEGIGCLPGKYKIQVKKDCNPVIHAPRKLPFAIKDQVKMKLCEMESQGIIEKVEGPTDWVNSVTIARKADGDLRICLDPKELNMAIKREHFRLPTLDDIVSNLSDAKQFSTLDATSGFWQVALSESCTDLCTFNTPFGRYKFLRMPYGICSASEVFHKKMFQNFDDLPGVCMYIDDLLIYGKDKEEHDERLRMVLERCRKINLKLNMRKCKFRLEEIKYLGHRITKNGLRPDDSHISAIINMPTPENVKDVERFLGLVTYVGSFVPNLSDKTLPLRELLTKSIEWHWNEKHMKCFNELKQCLSQRPILQYYSMTKPIVISVDASKSGLGACLMQDGHPVCYASKALTKTEQRYAQIEKELYACVFACERFYAYIYGRNDITIESDHKPLITIIKKPIVDAPSRLQRMLLRLQRYTFNLIYKPGKHLFVADALSRAYQPVSTKCENTTELSSALEEVCAVVREIAVNASQGYTDLQLIELQKQTESDEELTQLRKYILKGWPKARTHNVHRRAAEHDPDSSNANYEDQALADAAFGDDTQNDAEGDDEEEDVNATILSQGEEFKVGIGKTVRLPCTIEPSPKVKESVAFKWSRDGQDYFFGSMRVGAPERLHIDNETTTDLFITDLLPSDSGSYRCDIVKEASKTGEVQKPVFVEHTIRVEAPPKINEISATNRGQVVEGTEVQITCVVSGSPPPKIIWSKEEASGDSHALSENGTMYSPNSLTIKSVQREHAGKYICLADNRVGNPAVAFIKLQVLGKPRVHVHKSIINSEPNVAVVLQCAAHEEPPTEITWFKDHSPIQQYSARKTLVTLGQHSNLTVIPETDADFGIFTCQAENQYGKHERSIQLVQTPVIEELDVDGPKLSFNVHSHQMLLAVQLLIRAMNQDTSETQTIHLTVPEGSHHEYPMSFEFKGILAPGKYEVQVQAQNTYDWGQADPVVVDIETQPDSVIQHDSETQPESVIQPASVFRGAAHSTRTETALIASLIMYLFVRML